MIIAIGKSRLVRTIASVVVIGGAVALVLRLVRRLLDGHGLTPYVTTWGIGTTPVEVIVGLAVAIMVLGVVELIVWVRGVPGTPLRRRRRARGPI